MQEILLGYLLNALDSDEFAYVEGVLKSSIEARQQLEILRRALAPLEGDSESILAPAGLAIRTCQFIREQLVLDSRPQ